MITRKHIAALALAVTMVGSAAAVRSQMDNDQPALDLIVSTPTSLQVTDPPTDIANLADLICNDAGACITKTPAAVTRQP